MSNKRYIIRDFTAIKVLLLRVCRLKHSGLKTQQRRMTDWRTKNMPEGSIRDELVPVWRQPLNPVAAVPHGSDKYNPANPNNIRRTASTAALLGHSQTAKPANFSNYARHRHGDNEPKRRLLACARKTIAIGAGGRIIRLSRPTRIGCPAVSAGNKALKSATQRVDER